MSNVHVLALPRTGSKSLDRALRAANPDHLTFKHGTALGEYLLCRGNWEFKYSARSEYPYQYYEDGDNMMITHDNYFKEGNKNFKPVFNAAEGVLQWEECEYSPVLDRWTLREVIDVLIEAYQATGKTVILKTFLSALLQGSWKNGGLNQEEVISEVRRLNSYIDSKNILLYRRDALSWLCSRLLMNRTGAFINSPNQEQKIKELLENPVHIDIFTIRSHLNFLRAHFDAAVKFQPDLVIAMEDLSTTNKVSETLGQEVKVLVATEFSAVDYKDVIANYKMVKNVVDAYLQPVIDTFEVFFR